jgi:hypothetical protein
VQFGARLFKITQMLRGEPLPGASPPRCPDRADQGGGVQRPFKHRNVGAFLKGRSRAGARFSPAGQHHERKVGPGWLPLDGVVDTLRADPGPGVVRDDRSSPITAASRPAGAMIRNASRAGSAALLNGFSEQRSVALVHRGAG